MPVPQRNCEYCDKRSTSPCETKRQSDTCSRNGREKVVITQVSEEHKKPKSENNEKK